MAPLVEVSQLMRLRVSYQPVIPDDNGAMMNALPVCNTYPVRDQIP